MDHRGVDSHSRCGIHNLDLADAGGLGSHQEPRAHRERAGGADFLPPHPRRARGRGRDQVEDANSRGVCRCARLRSLRCVLKRLTGNNGARARKRRRGLPGVGQTSGSFARARRENLAYEVDGPLELLARDACYSALTAGAAHCCDVHGRGLLAFTSAQEAALFRSLRRSSHVVAI